MLQTQIGGNGGGGIITATSTMTRPDDDEPGAAVLEAEAFLLQLRITQMIRVTEQWNVFLTPLREQRGNVSLDSLQGGAM